MTHSELVDIAHHWALRHAKAGVAFKELVCVTGNGEVPDVIAFGGKAHSILIEVKVSRSDFLADAKKVFRIYPELGMGSHRIYCAPEGLLRLEELPDKWALLSVGPDGKATLTHRPDPDKPLTGFLSLNDYYKQPYNAQAESRVMYSALRRMQELRLVPNTFRTPTATLAPTL